MELFITIVSLPTEKALTGCCFFFFPSLLLHLNILLSIFASLLPGFLFSFSFVLFTAGTVGVEGSTPRRLLQRPISESVHCADRDEG